MAVMSWVVMVERITYVTRTRKANAVFMSMYNRLRGDVMNMEKQFQLTPPISSSWATPHSTASTSSAVHELSVRQEEEGNHPLSEETLEAIKATLDAAQIEEVQALDKGVVLLTISIAGGPFIGLLGTVLGVMITFASIALAGDVNVNAIAPGIAAALLATVTGLAVAIPALFGYNYISTQNSDVIAKTQIFGDRADHPLRRTAAPPPQAGGGVAPMKLQTARKPYDDINITPMLDLAFVLLVIFILLTTVSVQASR